MKDSRNDLLARQCRLPDRNSFFLFGARGTGKTTMLKQLDILNEAVFIDLLDSDTEEKFALRPQLLSEQAGSLKPGSWVVIDEIQKVPKLLDQVHKSIESFKINFALTGSSSRKLKRGGANLLAGRAFSFTIYPFTSDELGAEFNLQHALQWGTLPKVTALKSEKDKARFLRTYAQMYLKEEILVEQLIRNLDPFRLFLQTAAQMNTQIINYSNISRDTGVDYKTIQNYYQILVETNLGFFLEPYSRSVRKTQKQSPKFYLFDMGVKRSLQHSLTAPLIEKTTEYGEAFESWFINECFRLNHYFEYDYIFSYLRTKDDVEVDLIVERPDKPPILLEIKSSASIDERHVKSLLHFENDFPGAELILACRVPSAQKIGNVQVLPWQGALRAMGF